MNKPKYTKHVIWMVLGSLPALSNIAFLTILPTGFPPSTHWFSLIAAAGVTLVEGLRLLDKKKQSQAA